MQDSKNKNSKQSFWGTFPGILTGCAAVITAIGGLGVLITALFGEGVLLSQEATDTPTAMMQQATTISNIATPTKAFTPLPLTDTPVPTPTHTPVTVLPAATATPPPTATLPPPTMTPTPEPVSVDLIADADQWYRRAGPFSTGEDYSFGPDLRLITPANGLVTLRFNLSNLPTGVTIQEAKLYLYLNEGSESSVEIIAQRAISPWVEGEYEAPICDSGHQANRVVGLSPGWFSWDVTSIVQQQYSSLADNHGLCLVSLGDLGIRDFSSREGSDTFQPYLAIIYLP
ncbi:DNRLRE domain-containing protein [Candidatus Leptofilum sp.]|uniref:DNRLRE domain-containing protein n=1 Tax=Candidatus Leptofilum sp. TaxID=3241576 RepID=UPI003B5C8442